MRTSNIIPTVFATDKKTFKSRLSKLAPISPNIQIDFMDGKFVSSKSAPMSQIPNLSNYKNNFEAHLMVYNPEKYVKKLNQKGFKKIIFHIESTKNPERIIKEILSHNMSPWLAINPETKLSNITPYISQVHGVLLLGVHPGKEHQSFIPEVYKKIKELREISKIPIQVDGGINLLIAKKLANLKVDYLNSGSFISESKKPKQTYKRLSSLFISSKR